MSEPEAKAAETDIEEEQLNQAIEDLRGALHDEAAPEGDKAASLRNNAIIMNIPVDVQIMLGSAEMPVSELMARGEITVLDNDPSRFGVKLTEIITAGKTPR
jgi:flagellar motor switch protein FliN/FliY